MMNSIASNIIVHPHLQIGRLRLQVRFLRRIHQQRKEGNLMSKLIQPSTVLD